MFKKSDNIIFDRINQSSEMLNIQNNNFTKSEPPAPKAPPAPPSPPNEIKKEESEPLQINNITEKTEKKTVDDISLSPTIQKQQLEVEPPQTNFQQVTQVNIKEVENFKQICKQWLMLNNDIKKLQEAVKIRRQLMNELTPKMMVYMKDQNIENLDTGDGKLKYAISNRKVPLNKENIQKKLGEYFKNDKKAEEVASYIMDNRDIVKTERLSRTVIKKKK